MARTVELKVEKAAFTGNDDLSTTTEGQALTHGGGSLTGSLRLGIPSTGGT